MKIKQHHLILTVDYELFGNGSGAIQECMVNGANKMMAIADNYGAPLTFFVETNGLLAFSEQSSHSFSVNLVRKQLQAAIDKGHDAQLHIHPQWQDSRYSGDNTWQLDSNKWRIGDLQPDESYNHLYNGKKWLEDLLSTSSTSYKCIAFRAGGWCIQPSHHIVQKLLSLGFIIDSTIAPGYLNVSKGEWSDFRKTTNKPYWQSADDLLLETGTGLIEIPIATAKIKAWQHLNAIRLARRSDNGGLASGCYGDYSGPKGKLSSVYGKLCKIFRLGNVMLDFSTMPTELLITITQNWIERFESGCESLPIVAISHTKNFTQSSAAALNNYLKWAKSSGFHFSTYGQWLGSHDHV